jgi:hypothetical protein
LRYEALVSDPAPTSGVLCEFLGLQYDERMLRFHEGREHDDPGAAAMDHAASVREWFVADLYDRGQRLPAHWGR